MKRFQEFTENVDKVAALKAKQRTAVDKFKSSGTPDPKPKPERKVHQGNVETENLIPRLNAITEQNTEARIYIRGDRVVAYGRVMEVMSIINSAGYVKVALITQNLKQ